MGTASAVEQEKALPMGLLCVGDPISSEFDGGGGFDG
jgi:hypothetical protein